METLLKVECFMQDSGFCKTRLNKKISHCTLLLFYKYCFELWKNCNGNSTNDRMVRDFILKPLFAHLIGIYQQKCAHDVKSSTILGCDMTSEYFFASHLFPLLSITAHPSPNTSVLVFGRPSGCEANDFPTLLSV